MRSSSSIQVDHTIRSYIHNPELNELLERSLETRHGASVTDSAVVSLESMRSVMAQMQVHLTRGRSPLLEREPDSGCCFGQTCSCCCPPPQAEGKLATLTESRKGKGKTECGNFVSGSMSAPSLARRPATAIY